MSKTSIIADPGATWRIPGEPLLDSWTRMVGLIRSVAKAGADGFKPQFYRAAQLYPPGSRERRLVRDYELPSSWIASLAGECEAVGLEFMCTVYHPDHVALIDPYVRRHKVASFEAQREDLIAKLAATGKPLLVSLGLGQRSSPAFLYHHDETPLHCVSAYPADGPLNLARLGQWTGPKGFSDHSRAGNTLPAVMAVALGATVIERHVRAEDTPQNNPDFEHSDRPFDFAAYVSWIRMAEELLGGGENVVLPGEEVRWRYDPQTGYRGTRE